MNSENSQDVYSFIVYLVKEPIVIGVFVLILFVTIFGLTTWFKEILDKRRFSGIEEHVLFNFFSRPINYIRSLFTKKEINEFRISVKSDIVFVWHGFKKVFAKKKITQKKSVVLLVPKPKQRKHFPKLKIQFSKISFFSLDKIKHFIAIDWFVLNKKKVLAFSSYLLIAVMFFTSKLNYSSSKIDFTEKQLKTVDNVESYIAKIVSAVNISTTISMLSVQNKVKQVLPKLDDLAQNTRSRLSKTKTFLSDSFSNVGSGGSVSLETIKTTILDRFSEDVDLSVASAKKSTQSNAKANKIAKVQTPKSVSRATSLSPATPSTSKVNDIQSVKFKIIRASDATLSGSGSKKGTFYRKVPVPCK